MSDEFNALLDRFPPVVQLGVFFEVTPSDRIQLVSDDFKAFSLQSFCAECVRLVTGSKDWSQDVTRLVQHMICFLQQSPEHAEQLLQPMSRSHTLQHSKKGDKYLQRLTEALYECHVWLGQTQYLSLERYSLFSYRAQARILIALFCTRKFPLAAQHVLREPRQDSLYDMSVLLIQRVFTDRPLRRWFARHSATDQIAVLQRGAPKCLFEVAIEHAKLSALQMLLSIEGVCDQSWTDALELAARYGNVDMLSWIFKQGTPAQQQIWRNRSFFSCFRLASLCAPSPFPIMEWLLKMLPTPQALHCFWGQCYLTAFEEQVSERAARKCDRTNPPKPNRDWIILWIVAHVASVNWKADRLFQYLEAPTVSPSECLLNEIKLSLESDQRLRKMVYAWPAGKATKHLEIEPDVEPVTRSLNIQEADEGEKVSQKHLETKNATPPPAPPAQHTNCLKVPAPYTQSAAQRSERKAAATPPGKTTCELM